MGMTGERWLLCWASGAGAWCRCVWGTLSCCQGKILYQCREWGPEAGLAEKCQSVWVPLQKQLIQVVFAWAEICDGTAGSLGGVGVGLALVATQEWCSGCTCETVPRHPVWSGSLPAQLRKCSQVVSSPPQFLIEFYRENGFSLAEAHVKPAMRQSIS